MISLVNEIWKTSNPNRFKLMALKKIKVKQIASSLRRKPIQKKNLVGLGLNKMNRVVELDDTPSIRGMINKVHHLVKVISEE